MKKYIALAVGVLAVVAAAVFLEPAAPVVIDPAQEMTSLRGFFEQNISVLSPEKEVLGGKFYVTGMTVNDGEGTVSYEDGHNAYTADFLYSTDASGAVRVETFTVRK